MAIERHKRNPDYNFAVFFLDFDRFKLINDSLGHEVGDELLVAISERLHKTLRRTDSVSGVNDIHRRPAGRRRIRHPRRRHAQARGLRRLLPTGCSKSLGEPYNLRNTASPAPPASASPPAQSTTSNADDMLRDADTAMYHAKAAGKARYVLFDRQMHEQVTERLEMENELRHAVDRDQLVLHYQPVVSLQRRRDHRHSKPWSAGIIPRGGWSSGTFHPLLRGNRPDHSDRRLGPRRGLPPTQALAEGIPITIESCR